MQERYVLFLYVLFVVCTHIQVGLSRRPLEIWMKLEMASRPRHTRLVAVRKWLVTKFMRKGKMALSRCVGQEEEKISGNLNYAWLSTCCCFICLIVLL